MLFEAYLYVSMMSSVISNVMCWIEYWSIHVISVLSKNNHGSDELQEGSFKMSRTCEPLNSFIHGKLYICQIRSIKIILYSMISLCQMILNMLVCIDVRIHKPSVHSFMWIFCHAADCILVMGRPKHAENCGRIDCVQSGPKQCCYLRQFVAYFSGCYWCE